MAKTRRIHFRVDKNEYEKLLTNAQAKGYPFLSAYLRFVALEKDAFIENTIITTNKTVKQILQILEKK